MQILLFWAIALFASSAIAAEQTFNFADEPLDQSPSGFVSFVGGRGKPGEWKVISDNVAPALAPVTAKAASQTTRHVLAQLSRNPVPDHFPMLIFTNQTFSEFTFKTRFKIVGGALNQMAGIAFRFQNESNFYAVAASALAGTFQCFKVVDGQPKPPIGPTMEISKDTWHTMEVQCEGTRIRCALDGKDAIKLIDTASAGTAGNVGFWTKSDTVSYFVDAQVSYTPREILAQTLVHDVLDKYSRLLGLKIFAIRKGSEQPAIVASDDEKEIGQPGGTTEEDVIRRGKSYFSKQNGTVSVTLPLRDRNGDPIAAVRVVMKSFPGQTEQNALVRAQPILKMMNVRVLSLDQLLD